MSKATAGVSQPGKRGEEQENLPPAAAKCCNNAIPHLCGQQSEEGLRCHGDCFVPRKMPKEERCWFSVCSKNENHFWYSCCCCGQAFKNRRQYKRHVRREHQQPRRPTSSSNGPSNFKGKSAKDILEEQSELLGDGKRETQSVRLDALNGTAVDPGKSPLLLAGQAFEEYDEPMDCVFEDEACILQLPPPKRQMVVLPMEEMPEFQSPASAIYFERDQDGNGPASLVARALTSSEENFKYIPASDVELSMVLTDLCSRLTRPQKELLAAFLARYSKKLQADWDKKDSVSPSQTTSIDIPTDVPGLRGTIYEGVNSIFQNLPHPVPEWIEDHAYVSIIGCLEDLLAHGHDVDVISELFEACEMGPKDAADDGDDDDAAQASQSDLYIKPPVRVTKLRESMAAARILENSGRRDDCAEVTVTTYAIEWNDDCEPNNVKQHQGGIFVSSFTFASLPSLRNSLNHTYIVAVGPQHVSHECVERRIAKDLRILSGREPGIPAPRFYSKKHGGIVVPHLELISSLADQPMRRFLNGLIAGNGTYGARFGMSIDLASVLDEVVPCDACLQKMLQQKTVGPCADCTNWDMTHERIRMRAPSSYPKEELGADGLISPMELSYNKLKSWVKKAHDKYVSEAWGDKTTVAYLTAHALSTQAIKEIIQHAEAELVYKRRVNIQHHVSLLVYIAFALTIILALTFCRNRAEEEKNNGDKEQRVYEILNKKKKADPSQFCIWKVPAAWDRQLDFATNLDVIMHLCFLGSTHTLTDVIRKYLKRRSMHSKFVEAVSGRLEHIESLKLQNFKAHGFTNKNGSWVSEQWVALAKVMKWFFSDVSQHGKEIQYEEPAEPDYRRWTGGNCKSWLASRGLDTSGFAHDHKKRVADYMQQEGGPPDVLEEMAVDENDLLRLVEAHSAMISRIMSKDVTDALVQETETCIKVCTCDCLCPLNVNQLTSATNLTGFSSLVSSIRKGCQQPTQFRWG